ncbi:HpcH/HpaI aldolase/citrate lyase family protein [Streptomyces genisteinicus]|uniref:CoA ester lyase n=1 Tax=Streptomyces genisteinicus TaxID=2768068 RepID=A0A7H0HZ33_9ACTN|nr:CoA ester lyase [Streptomyces genisteinicus]QNP65799.1 CoA ester lyase [Streptomyces genisteinicus]
MSGDLPEAERRLAAARSFLFVPGDRPERFAKAAGSGAGLVIVDLEDAVAPGDKERARRSAADWPGLGARTVVRVNAPGTPWFDADLAMAAGRGCPVMLPKAEDPAVVAAVAGRVPLIVLVETALGVERAFDVCSVHGVVRAALGNVDLAAQLGVAHDDLTALAYARSRLVTASAAAGIAPPVDGVTTAVRDLAALTRDTDHARRTGFAAKLCIHPFQVGPASDAFVPTETELRWARSVVGAGDSVTTVDGHMIDRPVLERARGMLARAGS